MSRFASGSPPAGTGEPHTQGSPEGLELGGEGHLPAPPPTDAGLLVPHRRARHRPELTQHLELAAEHVVGLAGRDRAATGRTAPARPAGSRCAGRDRAARTAGAARVPAPSAPSCPAP